MVVDTAAGISRIVLQFSQAAQQVLVVLCDEPASLTDAYALIEVLSRDHGVRKFRVVVNQSRGRGLGQALFQRFERVASRFLSDGPRLRGRNPRRRRSCDAQSVNSVPLSSAYPIAVRPRMALKTLRSRPICGLWRTVPGATWSSLSNA